MNGINDGPRRALGLAVEFASTRLLTAGKDESFNVKGAYLEVWADIIGSVGVIIGALAVRFTGWTWVDPVIAVGTGLWMLPRTWVLLKGTINVLLEGVPGGLKLPEIRSTIAAVSASRAFTTCTSGRWLRTRSIAPPM